MADGCEGRADKKINIDGIQRLTMPLVWQAEGKDVS